ncbi:helix-turn-helix domain-containing protein [Paracoccus litorisediminis]|uniref:Helix-turn-helix domain-containing protein n=1 Tax=Paracoccus litorisediminis TaxID=2006130 RepID=A0A844HXF2_9RHOB|nr:helix-turn-helix transcriptional regulator [Paracoccus litorisediminis]MTH62142.1 helix-turn-helix domain-containing protein [Paracoccus litorisediminis]
MSNNRITETDIEINREFAKKLEEHLAANPELTPASLAVKAGLDNSAIRGIIAGRSKVPKLSTMVKISQALGLTLEEFMAGPRTPEELYIVRLVARLPVRERLQLLGYAQALDAYTGRSPLEDPAENQQSPHRP